MSEVRMRGVGRSFGTVRAVDGVDLDVPTGGLLAVVGPSGCGKTTLLRLVAGFERPDTGTIEIGGRTVADAGTFVPAHRRRVGVVPQEGALFEHLDVAGNVGFGLGRGGRGRGARVAELLELVGLPGLGGRRVHELSGGQRQRVALARALAPRPPVVLLDEPFSALDAGLRAELRADVRRALQADGATALLVTHDQDEALSMSDRVAVMNAGRILQTGAPAEVYGHPASREVAALLGECVLLPVSAVRDGVALTEVGTVPVRPGREPGGRDAVSDRAAVAGVVVRPEQIEVLVDPAGPAEVRSVAFHGHDSVVTVRLPSGMTVRSRLAASAELPRTGDRVRVSVRGEALLASE